MRPSASCFLAILLFLATRPAAGGGQSIPSAYRFIEHSQQGGAFAGYIGPDRGRFDFAPGPGPVVGVRYGIEIGGPFGFEAVGGFMPTTRDVIDPGRAEGDRKVGEANADIVTLDGRLKFSLLGRRVWNRIGPYLFAGGGIALDLAGDQPADEIILADDRFDFGTSFLGVLGTGARWLPTDRLEIRTDLTFKLWQVETPRGYSSTERDLDNVPEDEWLQALGATFGVAFRF